MPTRSAAAPVVVGAVFALILYAALVRLRNFSEYVVAGPSRDPMPEGALLDTLRALVGSPPLEFLHAVPAATAMFAGLGVALLLWRRARRAPFGQHAVQQVRLAERWELHERPRKESPSTVFIAPAEAGWSAVAWPLGYLASGLILGITERVLDIASDLGLAPATGPLVTEPIPVSAAVATLAAAFVLWRMRTIRFGEAKMLGGKIDH